MSSMETDEVVFDFDGSPQICFVRASESCYMVSPTLMLGPPYSSYKEPRVFHSDKLTILYMPYPMDPSKFYWSVNGPKGFHNGIAEGAPDALVEAFDHVGMAADNQTHKDFLTLYDAFKGFMYTCFG